MKPNRASLTALVAAVCGLMAGLGAVVKADGMAAGMLVSQFAVAIVAMVIVAWALLGFGRQPPSRPRPKQERGRDLGRRPRPKRRNRRAT